MLVTVGMDCLDVRLKSTGVGGTKSEEGRPVRQRSYPWPIRRASTGSITTPFYVLVTLILLDPRAHVLMREVNLNVDGSMEDHPSMVRCCRFSSSSEQHAPKTVDLCTS